jgi:hypothetical protein
LASDQGPGTQKGTGTRAKNTPSTDEAAPDAPENQQSSPDTEQSAAARPSEVKYTGGAGTRVITKAQWKGAGVEGQETTQWDATNGYTLPASDFSDKALEVLKRDPNLKIK